MLASLKNVVRKQIPRYYQKHLEIFLQLVRELRGYFKHFFYTGNQVLCPCCDKKSRKFLPFAKRAPNVKCCPRCGSHDRHRLMLLFLKNKTDIFNVQKKVIHFAPEYFLTKKLMKHDNIEYISADLTSSLAMVKFDITDIPYKDNLFDVILCSHVLEHVQDDSKAMHELYRILKPTGWAILQVPIDKARQITFEDPKITSLEDRLRFYGEPDHMRFYGLDYKMKLEKAGFHVYVDDYVKEFDNKLIKQYGLDVNEDIYYCHKV